MACRTQRVMNRLAFKQDSSPIFIKRNDKYWIPLTFCELHDKEVCIRPPPSMRALLSKALSAYDQHRDEYPNPRLKLDLYKQG
eukprot:665712-Amphidinium_carterae.1